MITSPSAHGSLASLGQYLKMTVGPPSISRGHYATFIPLECVHDVGAVAGEHNLRSPPKVSRAPNVSDIESLAPQQDGYGNLYTVVSQETRLLQVSPSGNDVRLFRSR